MFKILTIVAFYFCFRDANAQVRIGSNDEPNSNAILDLNNNFNGGLGLDSTSSPNVTQPKPEGMLYYGALGNGDGNLYLSQDGDTAKWNVFTPWIFKGHLDKGVSFPYTSGVGIRVNKTLPFYSILQIGQGGKEVNASDKSAALLIGDVSNTPTYKYMLFDNDEIMVKNQDESAATLKLQEVDGGSVQVGQDLTNQSDINVNGKVQENGGDVMPKGTIIMYYEDTTGMETFDATGLGKNEMVGWGICNGNTYNYFGTTVSPDLSGRFIVGAGTKAKRTRDSDGSTISTSSSIPYAQESMGGHDQIIQKQQELAIHNHAVGSLALGESGAHNHSYQWTGDDGDQYDTNGQAVGDLGWFSDIGVNEGSTNYNTGDAPSSWTTHTHSISGSTADNVSSPSSMTNQPPSVTVYYLIKLY
jgi:hypothetical protein